MSGAMTIDQLLAGLGQHMPVVPAPYKLTPGKTGLVIIDEVNGFATVGCGPLAPPTPNPQVTRMIAETDRLARRFTAAGAPVFVTRDVHDADRPEPPYPPHCIKGTGDEELVPALAWLTGTPGVTILDKDCINSFVGAIQPDGRNLLLDWIVDNQLEAIIYTGICTDICVMDAVLALLSARNHGIAGKLRDVVIFEPACATYDLPRAVADDLSLPPTASHPQALAHHLGLYFMASRGAVIASDLV